METSSGRGVVTPPVLGAKGGTTNRLREDTKSGGGRSPTGGGGEVGGGEPYLAGLRVLDLSRVLAGPLAAQVFGDLGAEVLKVEPPSGDDTRAWRPWFRGGMSAHIESANRSKASLLLDLKRGEGRARLGELLAAADVLIHNFLPASPRRLGLDDASLAAACPRLGGLGSPGHCR